MPALLTAPRSCAGRLLVLSSGSRYQAGRRSRLLSSPPYSYFYRGETVNCSSASPSTGALHTPPTAGLSRLLGCGARQPLVNRKRLATTMGASSGSDIQRLGTDDPRMSQIVIHGSTVYLSGQVADIATLEESDITAQTEQVLAKVDKLLAEAGTSKSRVLSAQIWVKDMEEHFAPMNEVWNSWIDPGNKPARACIASPMARPTILVEVMAIAAL